MAGGLLNLIAIGNQNIILNGNPVKSFFKTKYSKYTNFGLQKYKVEQQGQTNIHLTQKTNISFKIPRYGDLLMDTYLVITLPNIWSPIYKHIYNSTSVDNSNVEYRPYEFQWIKNIGCQIIDEVQLTVGGRLIQKFSGTYLQNVVERDFDTSKKELFNIMTGNISELNNPANYSNRGNNYPNAFKLYDASINGIEPSIYSKTLYIPLNTWFTLLSTMALPLICLQYAELEINFTLKPIQDLFTIKDVLYDLSYNNYNEIPRIQAEQNKDTRYGFYRFIQEPPYRDISSNTIYPDQRNNINANIHLITTQCFLDTEERTLFANNTQDYLLREVYEYKFERVNKSTKINLESNGLVSNWMWFSQRDDVYKRNEWSNYTNWPYENILPNSLQKLTEFDASFIYYKTNNIYQFDDTSKNIFITGYEPTVYEQTNRKEIIKDFAIIVDGKYRENSLPSEIYDKVEKYTKSPGNSKEGLYHYNFCLSTDPFKYQPSGAFNSNKFKNIEFEFNNHNNPPIDPSNVNFTTVCDPLTGEVIATSKEPTSIYKYNYNLTVMEERYNILRFQSGTADLLYSR